MPHLGHAHVAATFNSRQRRVNRDEWSAGERRTIAAPQGRRRPARLGAWLRRRPALAASRIAELNTSPPIVQATPSAANARRVMQIGRSDMQHTTTTGIDSFTRANS